MKPDQKRYSGNSEFSKKFWDRVFEIEAKKPKLGSLIYLAACALQDHESRLYQMLEDAEKSKR